MRKMPFRREYSQNFLKNRDLVTSLIERSSITRGDVVVEIGPGKGIITNELLEISAEVIAVEKDRQLYQQLVEKYKGNNSIILYNMDILDFRFPKSAYKVFSNVPFSIEGRLVRKLIDDQSNSPEDSYLVLRRELAERLSGSPREGQFSITHKPWFDMNIFYYFKRDDFTPKPMVESAMIRFMKRSEPLVKESDRRLYNLFIAQGFNGGRNMEQILAPIFSYEQLNHLSRSLGFRKSDTPTQLMFEQWLEMFYFLRKETSESQRQRFISKIRR